MCNAKTLLASEAVSFSSLSRYSVKKVDCLVSKFTSCFSFLVIAMIASCPLLWC